MDIPFAPEVVLPLLRHVLRKFAERHGFADDHLAEELNAIAGRLGVTKSFRRERINQLKNWDGTHMHVIKQGEWSVFLQALPEFRDLIRERIMRWIAPTPVSRPPESPTLAKQLLVKYPKVKTSTVPKFDSQLDVYEMAAIHIVDALLSADEAVETDERLVIAISGGRTQEILSEFIGRQVSDKNYRPQNIKPMVLALNDFNNPRQPSYNAVSIVGRWAMLLDGEPLAIPTWGPTAELSNYDNQLAEAKLIVLGAGNVATSIVNDIAKQSRVPLPQSAIGDLGGLLLDENGVDIPYNYVPGVHQNLAVARLKNWCASDRTEVLAIVPQPTKSAVVGAVMKAGLVNHAFLGNTLARSLVE